MPPKKIKKIGLKDKDIEETVELVNRYWSNDLIKKDNIKNPTRDFIINLHLSCVDHLDQKAAYALKLENPLDLNNVEHPGYAEEENLFLKLSKIPGLNKTEFLLGDLYKFDPVRVNHHIYIVMHFLSFTDSVMDDVMEICHRGFQERDNMEHLNEELDNIEKEKLEKQILLSEYKSTLRSSKLEAAATEEEYKEVAYLIEQSKQNEEAKIEETVKLQKDLIDMDTEIKQYKKREAELKLEVVTKDEYNQLQNKLQKLKEDEERLEDFDNDNGLLQIKQNIDYLRSCLRELSQLSLHEDLDKISKYHRELLDVEHRICNEDKQLQQKENDTNNTITKLKQLKRKLEDEYTNAMEKLKSVKESNAECIHKFEVLKEQSRKNNVNLDVQKGILKNNEDELFNRKQQLQKAYDAIISSLESARQRFFKFLGIIKANGEEAN